MRIRLVLFSLIILPGFSLSAHESQSTEEKLKTIKTQPIVNQRKVEKIDLPQELRAITDMSEAECRFDETPYLGEWTIYAPYRIHFGFGDSVNISSSNNGEIHMSWEENGVEMTVSLERKCEGSSQELIGTYEVEGCGHFIAAEAPASSTLFDFLNCGESSEATTTEQRENFAICQDLKNRRFTSHISFMTGHTDESDRCNAHNEQGTDHDESCPICHLGGAHCRWRRIVELGAIDYLTEKPPRH